MEHLEQSRCQMFESLDRPALRPLPEKPYEFACWKTARVNIDYHVDYDKHHYSVFVKRKGDHLLAEKGTTSVSRPEI
jgi:hypothetical protein